jgi:hypothetical protein
MCMIPRMIFLGLLFLLGANSGCSRKTNTHQMNNLEVHLQSSFSGNDEVTVTVDGREIYKGKPKSDPILGAATGVTVSNVSAHPILTFSMPSKSIYWSNQINLSAGKAIGFSWMPINSNGLEVRQATNFIYF